jgi:hypothetical protein
VRADHLRAVTIARASDASKTSQTFEPLFIVDFRLLIGVRGLRTPI